MPHRNRSEAIGDWDQKESGYEERKTKENKKKAGMEKMKKNKKLFKY